MGKVTYVTHAGASTTLEVADGTSVMQAAFSAGIGGIVAECGGSMMCATCHVYVAAPWAAKLPAMTATEDAMLTMTASERRPTSRLSCQIVMGAGTRRHHGRDTGKAGLRHGGTRRHRGRRAGRPAGRRLAARVGLCRRYPSRRRRAVAALPAAAAVQDLSRRGDGTGEDVPARGEILYRAQHRTRSRPSRHRDRPQRAHASAR